MEHKGRIEVETDFRVLPRTIYIPKWRRNIRNSRLGGTQTTVSASRRETTQINGVRDYVYGDRISRIHWNATAKTGSWKSKEFEHESFPRTMIVLDCATDGYDNAQQFELAVSAAASLIEYGAKEHAGTGLFTAAQEARMFAPADHAGERMRMIQHLVDVDYNRKGKLIATLEKSYRHFPKGALFLLISPMSGKEASEIMRWVETRGMNPCFLQITPSNETTKRDESISLLQSRESQVIRLLPRRASGCAGRWCMMKLWLDKLSTTFFSTLTMLWIWIMGMQWVSFTETIWLSETTAIVIAALTITAVTEALLPIKQGYRVVLQFLSILYCVYSLLKTSGNPVPVFGAEGFLTEELLYLFPYLWFAIAAWAIFLFLARWAKTRGRVLLVVGIHVISFAILDSFTKIVLWDEIAWVVGAGMGWLVSSHFNRFRRRFPQGWVNLSKYPFKIIANILVIFH